VIRLGEIRNFAYADAGAVAGLFQKTFRDSHVVPPSLETYFIGTFLEHPWFEPEIASRVHVDEKGRVNGFIGVFPTRFEHRGTPYRGAVAGTLMVDDPAREPLAGAKLLRSVVKGPQDITISETTNLISQRLWEPLGGTVVPLLSMDWLRPLRPAGAAVAALAEKRPGAAWLAPMATAADWLTERWARSAFGIAAPSARVVTSADVPEEEFAAAVLELSRESELRPAWTKTDLEWLVSHASRKERYGSPRRSIVRNRKGRLLGCYLLHVRSRGVGRVLQLLAEPGSAGDVLDCLLREASEAGAVGVRGRAMPQLMDAMLVRNCLFLHRASTVYHTKKRDLAGAIEDGRALITGLAAESWTRLVGGDFN
jgi:hypothetical protein